MISISAADVLQQCLQRQHCAVEEAAWAALHAKLNAVDNAEPATAAPVAGPLSAALLAKLLGAPEQTPSGISPSILAVAPHLAELTVSATLSLHF